MRKIRSNKTDDFWGSYAREMYKSDEAGLMAGSLYPKQQQYLREVQNGSFYGTFESYLGWRMYREAVHEQIGKVKTATAFEVFPAVKKGFDVKPYTQPSPSAASKSFLSVPSRTVSMADLATPARPLMSKWWRVCSAQEIQDRLRRALEIIPATPLFDKIAAEKQRKNDEIQVFKTEIARPRLALLPDDAKKLLKAARSRPEDQVISETFSIPIGSKEFKRLVSPQWLNDEIINAYLLMIQKRSQDNPRRLPSVHVFNTHFFTMLTSDRGYEGVQRWTRRVDLFTKDLVLIPIHLGIHWVLLVIDFRSKRVRYLDSLHASNLMALETIRLYLHREHQDKKQAPFEELGWQFSCDSDIPKQQNGYDCGVFTCINAECISRDSPLLYDQRDLLYFRDRIGYELLSERLLE